MKIAKITPQEFTDQFKVKEFKGQWDCYGTWNGLDMFELADTPENARIAMWSSLLKSGWALTEEEMHRRNVLAEYASKAKPGPGYFCRECKAYTKEECNCK